MASIVSRKLWKIMALLVASPVTLAMATDEEAITAARSASQTAPAIVLSEQHLQAVNRRRRIVVNHDAGWPAHLFGIDVAKWIQFRFAFPDDPGNQIDSIWWCLDEGNLAFYPSKVLPVTKSPQMRKWLDSGIDILKVAVQESHKRGIEAFYTYRLNGFDGEWNDKGELVHLASLPMKEQHPDWLLDWSWGPSKLWNFAVEGVREYKVAILREVVENYDFDGIDINFARHPPSLPIGQQWAHREAMTDFVRRVRLTLQEVAAKRGRPILLSVQMPSTTAGCHYDGYDIETWVKGDLIDIIVVGTHSFDVDLEGFRRLIEGKDIKLYPCMDDYAHPPCGYGKPPIEVERGVAANWWRQGADGIMTFNWSVASQDLSKEMNYPAFSPTHQQAYSEIGDPESLRSKDKTFVVTRRFGGGWENWSGPQKWNFNQNMNIEAPLPMPLSFDDTPSLVTVFVADDFPANEERIANIDLRLLISGAASDDQVAAKLNGILLPNAKVDHEGWAIWQTTPSQYAAGQNLILVLLNAATPNAHAPAKIEKAEARVVYQK